MDKLDLSRICCLRSDEKTCRVRVFVPTPRAASFRFQLKIYSEPEEAQLTVSRDWSHFLFCAWRPTVESSAMTQVNPLPHFSGLWWTKSRSSKIKMKSEEPLKFELIDEDALLEVFIILFFKWNKTDYRLINSGEILFMLSQSNLVLSAYGLG